MQCTDFTHLARENKSDLVGHQEGFANTENYALE